MHFYKLKIIFCTLLLCATVSSCSSVEYLDNAALSETMLSTGDSFHAKPSAKYGAIVLDSNNSDSNLEQNKESRVFLLKRNKTQYLAETMITDNRATKNALFQQSFFSICADRKNKHLGVELRFVY